MKEAIVVGAGMVGVCTGLQLVSRGWRVVLVDRQPPGQETSYGNAGIIQREAVLPYPFPRQFKKLLQVALGRGNDVRYSLAALPALMPKLARYWWQSAPNRYAGNARDFARLIEHCLSEHERWIDAADAGDLIRRHGWLQGFRQQRELDEALARARSMARDWGVDSQALSLTEAQALEPALRAGFTGLIHWRQPWTVLDPGALVQRYAQHFVRLGGEILQADISAMAPEGAGWRLTSSQGVLTTGQVVLALGPWAGPFIQTLGYRFPLFVKRGYHQHYRLPVPLRRPVLDAENGFAMAPMQRGLRITTGAEFAPLGAPPTPRQLRGAERYARQLVDLGESLDAAPWLGARPCTPDMKPVIGAAPRHPGLWFHFGHAHQGHTLGPVTARLLAECMTGEPPLVDPRPYAPERFV